MILDGKIPSGPLAEKWDRRRAEMKLVAPGNKRKYRIIVVGTGLAGSSAAASLAELGYNVDVFCFQDSPRRAHSIAAQGGINAAKNYANDGDSVERLFHDTIKGGDFRSREANVYRLAQLSCNIIDQAVAQGVPFARDYAGYLATRSFGGAQVSRTFYARGQTGQQLLLGAYGALLRQVKLGGVRLYPRTEMLDLVLMNGEAKGITVRDLVTGTVRSYAADAVCLCSGGYANVFFLTTNSVGSSVTAAYRAYKKGAFFANPCFTQIHPTCIPMSGEHQAKLTLMSESLRNDGRVWVPAVKGDKREPNSIPDTDRDYFLERKYPSYGNLAARDVSSRAAKKVCDNGRGVGPGGRGVYLDFRDAITLAGEQAIRERYGNLFEMYERITAENAYIGANAHLPGAALHHGRALGGLQSRKQRSRDSLCWEKPISLTMAPTGWGRARLCRALRTGTSSFRIQLPNYLARAIPDAVTIDHPDFRKSRERSTVFTAKLLSVKGRKTVAEFHRELGRIMWNNVGMARSADSLNKALQAYPGIRAEFWENVMVSGSGAELNQELEKAGRVADFLEFAELLAKDALQRDESCGAHFRVEHQTSGRRSSSGRREFLLCFGMGVQGRWQGAGTAQGAADVRACASSGQKL